MKTKIKVSGNIISELSEKIPTNIIALNELMKNSYDAGAKYVNIILDSSSKTLSIIDDGSGMNLTDINTLFHISNSTKKYGEINEYGRYTQGSKGLGFLSVFKFGKVVTWKTKKDIGYCFTVNFDDLLLYENIDDYNVDITIDNDIVKGTAIIIQLSEYSLSSLIDYLAEERNSHKIIHAFDDKDFMVRLSIDDKTLCANGLIDITDILPDRRLYTVRYDSKNAKIEFKVRNHSAITKQFREPIDSFLIELDLAIFHLRPYDKAKIDSLFINPQNDLTPLVYVNSNLFNNYTIFDPNIMRNIKNTLVLSQMIGYIRITSNNPQLNFNSDRTQFLQNPLTDDIINLLEELNKTIQETGAINKAHLLDLDILHKYTLPYTYANASEEVLRENIKMSFTFKDNVTIRKENNYVIYSIFGEEITALIEEKAAVKPARIVLKKIAKEIPIVSRQIDLTDYIQEIVSSTGESRPKSEVNIFVNGIKSENNILESIAEECSVKVRFEYNDNVTGKVIEEIELRFFQPTAELTADITKNKLLTIPTSDTYSINFNYHVGQLILQLNNLDIIEYLQVIACSLRALFDISTDDIRKSSTYPDFYKGVNALEDKVKKTIEYIKNDKAKCSTIAVNTGIDYNSLYNRLNPIDYYEAVKKAHMGAHKSTTHLSEPEIKELAHKASLFVVIVNEMLNNKI